MVSLFSWVFLRYIYLLFIIVNTLGMPKVLLLICLLLIYLGCAEVCWLTMAANPFQFLLLKDNKSTN